ncbi:hypothetical protein LVJ94_34660 [Pendulispora rubella]|uniref:Uncharacterized protein n=1 Tax=Pendulispora rubella TaxID=2741070 RepID=A0ABZ2KU49_9BACT
MRYQQFPPRVLIGRDEKRKDDVDIDASARYWFGVSLNWDDVVDYEHGVLGVAVAKELRPLGVPAHREELRQRWHVARETEEQRRLRSAAECPIDAEE